MLARSHNSSGLERLASGRTIRSDRRARPASSGHGRDRVIAFGAFQLFTAQGRLLLDDQPVAIGGRPLEILTALVERAGELVTKRQLMDLIWSGREVAEANLTVNVHALRRTLRDGLDGARYIVNIPGRGYEFVAPVTSEAAPAEPAATPPHNLPSRLTPLIGREATIRRLRDSLDAERLLTVVGAGGIGKTAVALEVAQSQVASFPDGVWLVSLAPIAEPRLATAAVASALKLAIRSEDPIPPLTAALHGKRLLLVLDNCEHLIDAVAAFTADLLAKAPGVKVLATSRQPLGIPGERLCRLTPLPYPPPSARLSAAEALAFPAVRLLVDRAGATLPGYDLVDGDAPYAAEICRRLDGIALAIELAAARVVTFGVRGLAARLDEQWRYLTNRHRGAAARHRTLGAALNWSHELLSVQEQAVFRRLAIFSGSFTLADAEAVVGGWSPISADTTNDVLELVAKSLVAVDVFSEEPRYCLLETTRRYASDKLLASGEATSAARRHAEHCRDRLANCPPTPQSRENWLADCVADADNIHAALTWAFDDNGDPELGISLTLAAIPLWLRSNDLSGCQLRTAQAIQRLDGLALGTALEMNLRLSFAVAVEITDGPTDDVCQAFTDALQLAKGLGDQETLARGLLGLAGSFAWRGDFQKMRFYAEECARLGERSAHRFAKPAADWMLGIALHLMADFNGSRDCFQRLSANHTEDLRSLFLAEFAIDPLVHASAVAAQTAWIEGRPDQALRMGAQALDDARRLNSPQTLCACLGWYAMTLLWTDASAEGDPDTLLDCVISELADESQKHSFLGYLNWADTLKSRLALRRGDLDAGLQGLRGSLERAAKMANGLFAPIVLCELAEALASRGRLKEALTAIEQARATAQGGHLWCVAEVLRVRGQVLARCAGPAAQGAEEAFLESLGWARRQNALAWELRTAMSLARLWLGQGRRSEAREIASGAYSRFSEGFETTDLMAARQLILKLA